VGVVVVVGVPLTVLIIWSFAFRWTFPDVLPEEWGLDAWSYTVSATSQVSEGLWNSIVIGLIVTALATAIGLPAARVLGLHRFRGKGVVEGLLLLPIVVPAIVATMGLHVIFIRLGLTGTYLGVSLIHLIPALPYFVLIMAGVFSNYRTELEETARTLGARPLQVFVWVTLPAIGPGVAVAAMFSFLVSWSQYVTTLLIGSGRVITLPLVFFPFITGSDHATAAAVSLVFLVPAILVMVVTSRRLSADPADLGRAGPL
jgi:putative spermidine/putrescine transport system permease protein